MPRGHQPIENGRTAGSLVENVQSSDEADGCGEPHNGGETSAADVGRAHTLHRPECKRGGGGGTSGDRVVGRPGISKNSAQVAI